MLLRHFIETFEAEIPLSYQETWDNSGLQVGSPNADVSSILLCLDVTEAVVDEAIEMGCQLVLSHHPLLFSGLKTIQGQNAVERCVMKAIKNDIAIYSAHTCLDNWHKGVNGHLAKKLGLQHCTVLQVQNTDKENNPIGSGYIGELPVEQTELEFLTSLKEIFGLPCLRHTEMLGESVKKVALCGGSGSFLLSEAVAQGADAFVSADFKYHDFFLPEKRILVADVGHYESEKHTKDIFFELISKKMPTFALYFSKRDESPIKYL